MSDRSSPRPAGEALPVPEARRSSDRSRSVEARRTFWVILWISCMWGYWAHTTEPTDLSPKVALAVMAALAVWLHLIHRIHSWNDRQPIARTVIMLAGAYAAFAALLWIASPYLVVLFGAYSLTFAFSDRVSIAVSMSLILTVIWIWAWVRWDLPEGGTVTPVLVWAVLNIINHFTTRVADQSEERGRLLDELKRTRAQLAASERRHGTLAERERLAAEIHDTLAQGFTSIVLVSEATRLRAGELSPEVVEQHLAMIEETARSNLDEARRLVDALRPAALEDRSLVEALETLASRVGARSGAHVTVEATGDDDVLGGSHDVVLLRVAQEALANCEKHSSADNIAVVLDVSPSQARLTIIDDGSGFDPNRGPTAAAGTTGGHGTALMRQRVAELGGTVTLSSEPERGTTVVVTLPRSDVQRP